MNDRDGMNSENSSEDAARAPEDIANDCKCAADDLEPEDASTRPVLQRALERLRSEAADAGRGGGGGGGGHSNK